MLRPAERETTPASGRTGAPPRIAPALVEAVCPIRRASAAEQSKSFLKNRYLIKKLGSLEA